MNWGVCCTAKAPLPQLLAFVAWYRDLGATQIWVHLDDADAAAAGILNQLDRVTAIPCDAAYWAVKGNRPARQEMRQAYNMQRVYALTDLPFLAHVDVDEYIIAKRPIADILEDASASDPYISISPAEALHDPTLPDDIFTARQFRLAFPPRWSDARKAAVIGPYAGMLPHNMLSHRAGKSLFRTGLAGFVPKLHAGAFGPDAPPLRMPKHPDLVLLHFHANDRTAWRAALDHRVQRGAYSFNKPLAAHLAAASEEGIDAFYDRTQTATPLLVDALRAANLLIEADLALRKRVLALPF